MRESGVESALLPEFPRNAGSPLGQGRVQKPSLEIVEVSETWRDDRQLATVGIGHIHSMGGMRSHDRDHKKESRRGASRGKSFWRNIVKGFKTSAISKPSGIGGLARREPEKTQVKRTGWVQGLLNLFRPQSKKLNHHKSSEMSTFGFNYDVVGSEDALSLLEHSHFQKGDKVASSANSELSAYHPLTSNSLPPSWILRKWKLRDSRKLLRIDPAEKLLFNLTDDASKRYTCSIKLENRTKTYVAFKFKSNSAQGYLMQPKHGVLAPSTTIEVKGLKIGDPFPSSASKKDLFVIVTLPLPSSLIKGKKSTISSSIFERFQDQCSCEAVFQFFIPSFVSRVVAARNVNPILIYGQVNVDAGHRNFCLA